MSDSMADRHPGFFRDRPVQLADRRPEELLLAAFGDSVSLGDSSRVSDANELVRKGLLEKVSYMKYKITAAGKSWIAANREAPGSGSSVSSVLSNLYTGQRQMSDGEMYSYEEACRMIKCSPTNSKQQNAVFAEGLLKNGVNLPLRMKAAAQIVVNALYKQPADKNMWRGGVSLSDAGGDQLSDRHPGFFAPRPVQLADRGID